MAMTCVCVTGRASAARVGGNDKHCELTHLTVVKTHQRLHMHVHASALTISHSDVSGRASRARQKQRLMD